MSNIITVHTYEEAKEALTQSLNGGTPIYLLGDGGNGKSYLLSDVEEDIKNNGYTTHSELGAKFVLCVNNIDEVTSNTIDHVIINMNTIHYQLQSTTYEPVKIANGEVMLSEYIKHLQVVLEKEGDLCVVTGDEVEAPVSYTSVENGGSYNADQGIYENNGTVKRVVKINVV